MPDGDFPAEGAGQVRFARGSHPHSVAKPMRWLLSGGQAEHSGPGAVVGLFIGGAELFAVSPRDQQRRGRTWLESTLWSLPLFLVTPSSSVRSHEWDRLVSGVDFHHSPDIGPVLSKGDRYR